MAKYRLQPHAFDFTTGQTADGRQILMGALYPDVVIAVFGMDGTFHELREVHATEDIQAIARFRPDAAEFRSWASRVLEEFSTEVGFVRRPIEVDAFDQADIGIRSLPEHFVDFLQSPATVEPDEQQRVEFEEEIRQWNKERRFVLRWGKDYWIKADGTVHST